MKKLILLSVLFIAFITVKAQDPIFVKGDKVINLGLGLDTYTRFSLSGEYGILDGIVDKGSIGVGAFASYGFEIFGSKYYHENQVLAGVRGTFHYPFIDKLDTYGGLALGLSFTHKSWDKAYWGYDDSDNYVDINSGLFVGARYYLTEKIAPFAELGYGLGYLTVGVAIKL
jgi:hypothetical protein